jgi:hypothetical protein
MNSVTQKVIEFLTHPELPFGTEEDLLLLPDPAGLQERVSGLVDEFPQVFGLAETTALKSQLNEAEWPLIGQEFQARVDTASSFFDPDAQAQASEASV